MWVITFLAGAFIVEYKTYPKLRTDGLMRSECKNTPLIPDNYSPILHEVLSTLMAEVSANVMYVFLKKLISFRIRR